MQNDAALGRQILAEHRAVRAAIRDIHTELERLRAEPQHAHGARELGRMLSELVAHLERHFALEELHGLLSQDPRVTTTVRRRAGGLLQEHRELTHELAALRDAAERAEQGALSDSFADGLQGFLNNLEQHEHAENELIQKLVLDDVGAGD